MRVSKKVAIGNKIIGGGEKILVQSMLNCPVSNIDANVQQAIALEKEGCEIIRATVPSLNDVKLIQKLKENVSIPVVADIHFDYKVAIECVHAGVDKVRINPGNIGDDDCVKQVVNACKQHNVPIRIGVNAGSLEKSILEKYQKATPQALCESAMYHISLLEKFDFDNTIVSIKSSNVNTMVQAYNLVAEKCNYPLHLGVTEAGTYRMGIIKSAMGIGTLLLQGIGDTIRVSLTDDPIKEVQAGYDILRASGHKVEGVEIVSCPTCGRTSLDVVFIANQVEQRLKGFKKNLKVAVMGCAVNGPGEAKEADIGIACGKENAVLFKKGVKEKVLKGDILTQFIEEIYKM